MADDPSPGTTEAAPSADPLDAGTGSPAPGATAPAEGAGDDAFFDPATLPDEIKPHWKKMQATFTKKMQGIRKQRDDVDLVARYRTDPAFARAFIAQESARLGIAASEGTPPPAPPGAPASAAPPALVEAARRHLPPELQWMAPALAAVYGEAHRQTVEPELRQRREADARTRQDQWDELAAQLGETAPGWEAHEEEMSELLNFFQSDAMHNRRWGSKLDLLYRLASGSQAATTEAARRMGSALRQRVVSGTPGRTTTPNVTERIVGAKSNDEAWQIAARHAVEQMSTGGGTA